MRFFAHFAGGGIECASFCVQRTESGQRKNERSKRKIREEEQRERRKVN